MTPINIELNQSGNLKNKSSLNCSDNQSDFPNGSIKIENWFEQFHCWNFIQAQKGLGKPNWITINKYPLNSISFYKKWLDPEVLIGVRFDSRKNGVTNYCLVDVDISSQYHPTKSPQACLELIHTLEVIGLCRYLIIRSSDSEGLHIYFPLPEKVLCYGLASTLKHCLETAGYEIKNGQLEIFPNVSSQGALHTAHRLPLQVGSFVLDEDFQPIHNSIESLVDEWNFVAQAQNADLIKESISSVKSSFYGKSETYHEWKGRLEDSLQRGWTSQGQTNDLIKEACIYGCVFLGLSWIEMEEWGIQYLKGLPGYQLYCNHKRDIKQRVKDWVKSNRRSGRYHPYLHEPRKPKVRLAPSNEERSAGALARIQKAIAQIIAEQCQLPGTVRARQQLISKVAKCSPQTLWKHKELWHPACEIKGCVTPLTERVSEISEPNFERFDTLYLEESHEQGCVTLCPIKGSEIFPLNFKSGSISETTLNQGVTHTHTLSVKKLLTPETLTRDEIERNLYSNGALGSLDTVKLRSRPPKLVAASPEKEASEQSWCDGIALNSIVRRKSDGMNGAKFLVTGLEAKDKVWLRWLDQYVSLVDFPWLMQDLVLWTA